MRFLAALFLIPSLLAPAPREQTPKSKAPVASKAGVKTPGVQIPYGSLKSEAEIPVESLVPGAVFADQIWIQQKSGIAKIDPKANKPGDPVSGLKQPCAGVVSAFNSLWSPDCGTQTLLRIDTKTAKITASIGTGAVAAVRGIAASADSIWLLTDNKATLARIDPDTNKVVSELRLPPRCNSLLSAENSLWVTCPEENKLLRIDPLTNLVKKSIDVAASPRSVASGEGSLWVLCETEGKVSRIDPKTDKVTATIDLAIPNSAGEIVTGEGSVWVTANGFPLTRIDPGTDKVVQQFHGDAGGSIHFGAGSLWLGNAVKGTLTRIDPKRVAATLAE